MHPNLKHQIKLTEIMDRYIEENMDTPKVVTDPSKVETNLDLLQLAQLKSVSPTLIKWLANNPLFPIKHTDFNVPEFGLPVSFIGSTNETGIKYGQLGFILGIARTDHRRGRTEGWMEVLFESGAVYGLKFDDLDFCVEK